MEIEQMVVCVTEDSPEAIQRTIEYYLAQGWLVFEIAITFIQYKGGSGIIIFQRYIE